MAGKRRQPDGTVKPLQRDLRNARRQGALGARFDRAQTPAAQLSAALDALRAALPRNQAADRQIHDVVEQVMAAADEAQIRRNRARYAQAIGGAQTGRELIGVAMDYVRAVTGKQPLVPLDDRTFNQLTHHIAGLAARLTREGGQQ